MALITVFLYIYLNLVILVLILLILILLQRIMIYTAPYRSFKPLDRPNCQIFGKNNHGTWVCFYNNKGSNYIGSGNSNYSQMKSSPVVPLHTMPSYHIQFQHPYLSSHQIHSQQS